MKLPDELTTEQERVLIECIKIFAARGKALREAREKPKAVCFANGVPVWYGVAVCFANGVQIWYAN